jgi:hypothetical protein
MMGRKYDHWWEWGGDFIKDAMKGWGLGALFFLTLLGVGSYLGAIKGREWIDNRMKVDLDTAEAARMNAETNCTNAETSKQVAEAVTRLTGLQDKMATQHDLMIAAIRELKEYGTVPAQEVREMMQEARDSMAQVPALREEANRISKEHLETTRQVLKVLEGTERDRQDDRSTKPKNPPASPSPESGDALKS